MRKIIIFIISILFFVNRDKVILSGITALNIWSNTLFPLLFSTFVLNDLIISTNIASIIIKLFGPIYQHLFGLPKEGAYIFIMSMISGTPSNAKNIQELGIDKDANIATRIICSCYFFNPLFIITYTNIKVLIAIYVGNIISSILMNFHRKNIINKPLILNKKFDLSRSIERNISILLNILGTITIFLILSSIIPIKDIYLKTLLSGILELTTGLNLLSSLTGTLLLKNIILSIILSFGGLSILYQIKSILKDTSLDYKYFIKNRILCSIIMFIIIT